MVSLGLGALMEIGQCSTMKRARAEWQTDSETRDADGVVGLYRMTKFALDVEIFMFKICVYVAF